MSVRKNQPLLFRSRTENTFTNFKISFTYAKQKGSLADEDVDRTLTLTLLLQGLKFLSLTCHSTVTGLFKGT